MNTEKNRTNYLLQRSFTPAECHVQKEAIAELRSVPLSISELRRLDRKTIRSSAMDVIEATAPLQADVEYVTRKKVTSADSFEDSLLIELIDGSTIYMESKECTFSDEDSYCILPPSCWE